MTKIHCDVCGESTSEEQANQSGFTAFRLLRIPAVAPIVITGPDTTKSEESHLCKKCRDKTGSLQVMLKVYVEYIDKLKIMDH